jgi:LacI family transcriptional regulator
MPTIHDIARQAGVSITTVSRAFRSPGLINEETQRRILDVARQLDYTPRSSSKKPTVRRPERRTIAFEFFADRPADTLQVNAFYGAILFGAQTEAARLGMNLMVHTMDRHRIEEDLPDLVAAWDIAAILLVGGYPTTNLAELYRQYVSNLILLDNREVSGRYESVASDGFGGAVTATRYLNSLGHQNIGFLLRERGVEPFEERMRGYQWAMQSAGLALSPHSILALPTGAKDEEREALMIGWLRNPERPTAIIASNDDTAVGLLQLCRQLDIQVPQDLSLIGFDDITISQHVDPPLTTLRVEKEFMGRLAVRIAHARVVANAGEKRAEPLVQHSVAVRLVVRHSCRPL